METVWVLKGDDQRMIERRHLALYEGNGYERCDPPAPQSPAQEAESSRTELVTLYKNGNECQCDKGQVAAMEATGWSREKAAATKGVTTDGGNQHEGEQVDQEHGTGDDRDEPEHEEDGLELGSRQRRNRSYRRKRGNDEDS